MSFFYDLNKKLDEIRATPSTTHGQLNERDEGKPGKNFEKIAKDAAERYGSKAAGERVAGAVRNKLKAQGKLEEEGMSRHAKGIEKYGKEGMEALAKAGREGKDLDPIRAKYDKYDESMDEGMGDMAKKIGSGIKKVAKKALDVVAPDDETLLKDLQKKAGVPQTGKPPQTIAFHKSNTVDDNAVVGKVKEAGAPMTDKQKSFAALAEPKDKITFADKIAGAKKEVDEMLGDVAAEAMKKAIGGHSREMEEGWDDMMKAVDQRRSEVKAGHKVQGAKGEIEKTATGIRHTRRYDAKTGETDTGDDAPAQGEKRGRGRPKGSGKAMGAKGPSGKSKLMTKEAEHDSDEIKQAMAMLKKAGYKVEKAKEDMDEEAVSVKQRRAAGIAHAAQKGEIPKSELKGASKEMAKMPKGELHKFAATKEKGLPEKKKKEEVEETTVAGNVAPAAPKASKGGMTFGKGIYDSMNRELEQMIAESMSRLDESMNISMSMNNDDMNGGARQSLTVTATDEDAVKLGQLLKMAGLGASQGSGCGCGASPCNCGSNAQVVDENSPDWPTNTETSDDAMQYSGGLNKPKSTGQTTVPVIASQDERQHSYAEAEEDAIKRMMEMAGVKKKEVEEEKTEEGNLFTGNLAKARAAGKKEADLDGDGDMEKVKESIFDLTNQWKVYKG